ncbi:uncharacterized protein T28D9.1 [Halyomorpha halys]|uniref:uncharacterized protein T28D9.1 n=1 Tax=Halyomorpha halys TaxID=286706 RepID=UPI0006D4E5AC|nr:uncharacterized protein LOC106678704 [Halyomorpha halys]
MSDTSAETKETQAASSPEKKEVVCERKPAAAEKETKEEKKTEDKPETNGHSKTEESTEEKPVENGDATDVCSLPQKRKSEVGSGDTTEKSAEGASPEKKAKLEEKVENGEAEAKA